MNSVGAEDMATMTGAITPYLAVLGRPEDDADVRALTVTTVAPRCSP